MRYLKTNTATRITVGPFLDKTDGITPEVALTVTSEKLTFVVDDGGVPTLVLDAAPTASGGNNDMVHITNDDAGFYDLELAAANVNYLGRAILALTDVATHLPVFHEFMILSANAYDHMFGTGNLNVDVIAISGDTAAADNVEDVYDDATSIANLKAMFDGTGYAGGTIKLNANVSTIANDAITAAAIANGAIDAATFAAGAIDAAAIAANAIDAATFAADVDAEIATMIWNAAAASYGGAGTYGQAVEDILTDTGTTLDARIPAALVGGRMDSSVGAMAAGVITATAIADAAIDAATFAAGAINAAAIADGAIDAATFAAGAIDAAAIAAGAIDNATFAADVGTTAFATNVIALAVFKALDSAITDAVSLTAGGLLEKVRKLSWILCNKMTVADASGNTVVYKDDSVTAAYTVDAALTDVSTTTTRLRIA